MERNSKVLRRGQNQRFTGREKKNIELEGKWGDRSCKVFGHGEGVWFYSKLVNHLLDGVKIGRKKASLIAEMVKNPPAMQDIWIQSVCWKDILEKEGATHTSILAWQIPWTEAPGGIQSMGSQRVGHDWTTNTHTKWERGRICFTC